MSGRVDQIERGIKHIISNCELYRPTYPLNFVEDLSENDGIWEKDIVGSIDKEIRYLLYIYMKVLCEFEFYRTDNLNLYSRLVSNELEHFILRFPIILDILEKHFLKLVSNIERIEKVIPLNSDLISIRKIRNEIIHHGAQCVVREYKGQVSFNIIAYRQTIKAHFPNQFLMISNQDEYYSVSNYMTWMLSLLLNYLDDFFKEINRLRMNGRKVSEKHVSEVINMDEFYGYGFSRIKFYYGEIKLFKDNLDGLLIHVQNDSGMLT